MNSSQKRKEGLEYCKANKTDNVNDNIKRYRERVEPYGFGAGNNLSAIFDAVLIVFVVGFVFAMVI